MFVKYKKQSNKERDKIMINLYSIGKSMTYLSGKFNISRQRVEQIINQRKNLKEDDRYNILYRDDFKCQWNIMCNGDKKDLEVHHIDGNPLNNSQSNLITLCVLCHKYFHSINKNYKPCSKCGDNKEKTQITYYGRLCKKCHLELKEKKKDEIINRWSKYYDNCISCGSNKNKHTSNGLCSSCWFKIRYKANSEYYKQLNKKWKINNPIKAMETQKKATKKYLDKLKMIDPIELKLMNKYKRLQRKKKIYLSTGGE
jgi:hypothetical protein